MDEQTLKTVEKLAQKLGTTSEYLWKILVKQAPVESSITLFQYLLVGIFGYTLFKLHNYLSEERSYGDREWMRTGYAHYVESAILPMIILISIFLILSVCCFFSINKVINGFFNPEFWALNYVLGHLK